jgi:hypothetical protein
MDPIVLKKAFSGDAICNEAPSKDTPELKRKIILLKKMTMIMKVNHMPVITLISVVLRLVFPC